MSETGEDREGIQGKTIVLSGALTPARFRGTDTVLNIGCGTRAAQSLPPGVYLAMNCRICPGPELSDHQAIHNDIAGILQQPLKAL